MSSLLNYNDAYRLANVAEDGLDNVGKQLNKISNWVVFRNCAPFIDCTSEISNT